MGNCFHTGSFDVAYNEHSAVLIKVANVNDNKDVVSKGKIIIMMNSLVYIEKCRGSCRRYCEWPLKYIKNYGWENEIFTFEATSKCMLGKGTYLFKCKQPNANILSEAVAYRLSKIASVVPPLPPRTQKKEGITETSMVTTPPVPPRQQTKPVSCDVLPEDHHKSCSQSFLSDDYAVVRFVTETADEQIKQEDPLAVDCDNPNEIKPPKHEICSQETEVSHDSHQLLNPEISVIDCPDPMPPSVPANTQPPLATDEPSASDGDLVVLHDYMNDKALCQTSTYHEYRNIGSIIRTNSHPKSSEINYAELEFAVKPTVKYDCIYFEGTEAIVSLKEERQREYEKGNLVSVTKIQKRKSKFKKRYSNVV